MFLSIPGRRIGWTEVCLHLFFTSAQDGGERLTSYPGRCTPGNAVWAPGLVCNFWRKDKQHISCRFT
jgi:hypothetical protein